MREAILELIMWVAINDVSKESSLEGGDDNA